MTIDTKIYALCGVDGAGKSTILDEIERQNLLPGAVFVRRPKESSSNSAFVRRYLVRRYNDGRDWIGGAFANAMGIALAFEFLDHYEKRIEPLIGRHPTVICDRYALCFDAYVRSIQCDVDVAPLFARLKTVTHTFYVHVPTSALAGRYELRGGAQDDENHEVMSRFDQAYRALLPIRCSAYSYIDNGGPLMETMRYVKTRLKELGE